MREDHLRRHRGVEPAGTGDVWKALGMVAGLDWTGLKGKGRDYRVG